MTGSLALTADDEQLTAELKQLNAEFLDLFTRHRDMVDQYAIAIYCDTVRIGFVPAELNLVCSRLMDAGKLFFCRVVSRSWKGSWLKIKANIYMVE